MVEKKQNNPLSEMNNKFKVIFIVIVGLLFLIMFYYPVLTFIFKPLLKYDLPTFFNKFLLILSEARFQSSLLISIVQASLSALISTVIAFPIAYITSRYSFRLAKILRSVSIIPFVLPSIIVIVAMLSLYGKNGLINRILGTEYRILYGLAGIILSHIFYNLSIAYRFLESGWNNIDVRYRHISKSLGEGKLSYIKNVVLPDMLPYILSSFFVVFVYSFFSFAIVLSFGGIQFSTLEVQLYNTFINDISGVTPSIYGLIQLIISLSFIIVLVIVSNLRNKTRTKQINTEIINIKYLKPAKRVLINFAILVVLIFILLPLLSILVLSFENNGTFTLDNYINLFGRGKFLSVNTGDVVLQSISISIPSAIISVLLCLIISLALKGSKSKILEIYMLLPIGISTVSLSYGISFLFGKSISPILIIILIHSILAFPIGLRLLKSYIDNLPQSLIFISQSLGASKIYTFRKIELPIYSRGIANAFSYAIAISLSELTAVFVIGRGSIKTIPILIYQFIQKYQFGQALSLSVLYVTILFIIFSIVDKRLLRD